MNEIPLSDGWTACPYSECGYVYVEWLMTGSWDPEPRLPPLLPHEATRLADALTAAAHAPEDDE